MFQPFTHPSQFYPGLIVWCDPNCREIDASTLAPSDLYDRRKARDLRPCLVVSVDYPNNSFQVSRICATTPLDTRRWVRVDTAPAITWRRASSDAWIWIGTPPTVAMVFNDAKRMHPHKDTQFILNPIAAANVQNYWAHRTNYLNWCQTQGTATHHRKAHSRGSTGNTRYPATHHTSNSGQINGFNHIASGSNHSYVPTSGFNTLGSQPVVVPAGFTETNSNTPGWWRNPETGWFWHASRGVVPPPSRT
ncbi:hypothetical protein B0H14DRAFT_3144676 [Mycena olivaceomarginata]|nr:hypothetical protein B0H14DRAFT_3144676 [Mycena olivaceomarginata]